MIIPDQQLQLSNALQPVKCGSARFNKHSQSYNLVLGIKKKILLNQSALSGIKILSGLTT